MGKNRPSIRHKTRWRVIIRDGARCRYCNTRRSPFWDEWEIDHIYPVARGGRNRHSLLRGNLALACRSCNRSKSAHLWVPRKLKWYNYILSALMIILFDWPRRGDY